MSVLAAFVRRQLRILDTPACYTKDLCLSKATIRSSSLKSEERVSRKLFAAVAAALKILGDFDAFRDFTVFNKLFEPKKQTLRGLSIELDDHLDVEKVARR